jgi:3-oxoadipate enol-lactonase
MWFRVLPSLAPRHRIILFDNRGMGRSSVPRGLYSIPRMARDAYIVLGAAGESAAHVVGASMGGMIAQELALRHPEAVRSLLLGCTSHSGLFGRWPDFSCVPRSVQWSTATRIERERSLRKLLYADTTPLDRIEEDMEIRCACQWCKKGFVSQLAGILMWSSYRRLPRIRVPTLVVHGDQDRLVPAENGRAVARRIPGAVFRLVPDAGHILTTDQPDLCSEIMVEFLNSQQPLPALTLSPALPALNEGAVTLRSPGTD